MRLAQLKLRSHFLNLCSLLIQLYREGFDFLPLFGVVRFQFLHFTVLFKEFVEQHRVDGFVAHAADLSILVSHERKRYTCEF